LNCDIVTAKGPTKVGRIGVHSRKREKDDTILELYLQKKTERERERERTELRERESSRIMIIHVPRVADSTI